MIVILQWTSLKRTTHIFMYWQKLAESILLKIYRNKVEYNGYAFIKFAIDPLNNIRMADIRMRWGGKPKFTFLVCDLND